MKKLSKKQKTKIKTDVKRGTNDVSKMLDKGNEKLYSLFGKKPPKKRFNIFTTLIFLFVAYLLIESFLFLGTGKTESVPLSRVLSEIQSDSVENLKISGTTVEALLTDGSTKLKSEIPINTDFLTFLQSKDLLSKVKNVETDNPQSVAEYAGLIINILFFGLFAFFILSMFKQKGGPVDLFSFGKSRAKLFSKNEKKQTTFDNVAVEEEIKGEMYELVDFLKNPKKYEKVGARIPKGVLLVGPSGVGKTLIARAIAGEAGVKFYSAAGSEFMEMLVGVGSARVRDMFLNAKLSAPSLIFIDEIDAIGRQRGMGIGGGHDEREQTLNQILVEMDGFEKTESVIVIAATNRPDMLDPALVRPGRFDRKITLSLPTIEVREKIIDIHIKGKPLEEGVNLKQIAKRTVGFSGADIENMLNEAAILAARENREKVSFLDISEASTKVKLGPERKKLQDESDKKLTAYHEAGHAIVAHFLPHVDPVRRISIVARTYSLGHTDMSSEKEELNYTKQKLNEQLAMIFGGRVAEQMFFNEMSSGASSDIERATDIARSMVTEWGMSDMGPIHFAQSEDKMWLASQLGTHIQMSDDTLKRIDAEIAKIIDIAKKLTEKIIKENKQKLIQVAEELIKVETLEEDDFIKIVGEKVK